MDRPPKEKREPDSARAVSFVRYLPFAPLDVSVPFAPPEVPELELPLGALELVELETSPAGAEGVVAPAEPEPYCWRHLSRSSPTMVTHWLGVVVSEVVAPVPEVEPEPYTDVLGVVGEAVVSVELVLV